jgi:hypothetical protein
MSTRTRTADAVARRGEPVCIRRSGQPDIQTMAVVRTIDGADLIGDMQQNDRKVSMGATDIIAAGWPSLPKRGDQLLFQGIVTSIQLVSPFYSGGELVRLEMMVRG